MCINNKTHNTTVHFHKRPKGLEEICLCFHIHTSVSSWYLIRIFWPTVWTMNIKGLFSLSSPFSQFMSSIQTDLQWVEPEQKLDLKLSEDQKAAALLHVASAGCWFVLRGALIQHHNAFISSPLPGCYGDDVLFLGDVFYPFNLILTSSPPP